MIFTYYNLINFGLISEKKDIDNFNEKKSRQLFAFCVGFIKFVLEMIFLKSKALPGLMKSINYLLNLII